MHSKALSRLDWIGSYLESGANKFKNTIPNVAFPLRLTTFGRTTFASWTNHKFVFITDCQWEVCGPFDRCLVTGSVLGHWHVVRGPPGKLCKIYMLVEPLSPLI